MLVELSEETSEVIAICIKLVKTQINTKSAQITHETCESDIFRTTQPIVLISFAIGLPTSPAGPGALNTRYLFLYRFLTNSSSNPIVPSLRGRLLKNRCLDPLNTFTVYLNYQ